MDYQLEWRDLDLARARLTIRPELGKSRQEKTGGVVPISAHLVDAAAGWGRREGLLIETTGDARRIDYAAFRRAWELAGVPQRQPFHPLRKAFASELRRQGVQTDVIARLVGHAQGTTADVYLDPYAMAEEMRAAVDLITAVGETREIPLHARS